MEFVMKERYRIGVDYGTLRYSYLEPYPNLYRT